MTSRSSEFQLNCYDTLTLLALTRCRGVSGQRALRFALGNHRHELVSAGLDPHLGSTLTPLEARLWSTLQDEESLQQALEWAREEHARHIQIGARLIGFFDSDYPPLLRLIPTPPPVLFVLGDLTPLLNTTIYHSDFPIQGPTQTYYEAQGLYVAVVGTRQPTKQGLQRAWEVSQSVVAMTRRSGQSNAGGVISGLALGIDGCAHRATLDAGGYTIAVLGHGLDQCYPKQHRSLADQIISSGGALISEQPWLTPPHPYCLVARDRIQAGLSAGVIIAETGFRGGALHTARAALRQGRSVCLPSDHRVRLSKVTELNQYEQREQIQWVQDQHELSRVLEQIALHSYDMNTKAGRLIQMLTQRSQEDYSSPTITQQDSHNPAHHQQLTLFK